MEESLQHVIIRFAHKTDAFGWQLMRQKLRPDGSAGEHKSEIGNVLKDPENLPAFVAEEVDGNLVGFLEASIHHNEPHSSSEDVLYIEGWFVEPAFRKQYTGKKLMEAAGQWGREKGLTEIFSDVELANDIGHKAHRAMGFIEAYRNDTCIVYKKNL